ncbi:MAG: sensor histidine kinase [Lachnospiraceae bacterium]|nr:sensor histidine kinase [Lachnospiraceae bacterium]
MIHYFSFYKPLFMAQLLVAEFLFSCRLPRREHFWLRYAAMAAIAMGISAVLPWQPQTAPELSAAFLLLFAFTCLLSFFCFDASPLGLLFCHIAAYTTQHFAYCLSNCMLLLSNLNANVYGVYTEEVLVSKVLPVNEVFGWIFTFVIYYLSYYLSFLFFGLKLPKKEEPPLKNLQVLAVSAVAIVLSIFVNSAIVYGSQSGDLILLVNAYNAVCCVFIMYMLFSVMDKKQMENELTEIYEILRKSSEQYKNSRRTIELINIKCHDLKHQIREIGQANAINETALAEISDVISIYDSEVKTGNPVLDTILTEKSLYCYKNKIKLTCMADGSRLGFMNEAELYSLFGNAIDNAITAVRKVEDESRRYIGLNVSQLKGFVKVNIHNYYEGELNFSEEGLPLTTKADKENHGFGMKSIRYIVEKYGGTVSVKTEKGVFNLNILFPAAMA